ncbi:MAG: peptidylprolyl isomerase [Acidobacteriaceae bacterium]|nr:peptidylprolyl isomerase [Acidobacteriaceae bacterium]
MKLVSIQHGICRPAWCPLVAMMLALSWPAIAQSSAAPQAKPAPSPDASQAPAATGTTIDRVVAIVNNDLVLDSDVDEERRFAEITPVRDAGNFTRERIITRLINRDLILQQVRQQSDDDTSDSEFQKSLVDLRKSVPACKDGRCDTDAKWRQVLAGLGFTEEVFNMRWKQRLQVLAFIEQRFKQGIRITDTEIQSYYEKTFVPQYSKRGGTPPALAVVHDRIEEVLLEQQVSNLLSDWLKSLRAQGQVVVLHPGETAP